MCTAIGSTRRNPRTIVSMPLLAEEPADATRPGSVRLGFRTRQPLGGLALRLTNAGYSGATVSGATVPYGGGGELTVTDPDGQQVLVQPAPRT